MAAALEEEGDAADDLIQELAKALGLECDNWLSEQAAAEAAEVDQDEVEQAALSQLQQMEEEGEKDEEEKASAAVHGEGNQSIPSSGPVAPPPPEAGAASEAAVPDLPLLLASHNLVDRSTHRRWYVHDAATDKCVLTISRLLASRASVAWSSIQSACAGWETRLSWSHRGAQ